MWRTALVLALLSCGSVAAQSAGLPETKPFIRCDNAELLRAVPDLAGIQFDARQDGLDAILAAAGENLAAGFSSIDELSAAEEIHEMRFENNVARISRRETFRYLVQRGEVDANEQFTEVRLDPATGDPAPAPAGDFLVTGHFFNLLRYLAPENRERSSFRYLGHANLSGEDCFVVAFSQLPESTDRPADPLQGIVWLDAASHRIARLRTELLRPEPDSALQSLTTDITVLPVKFPHLGSPLWLPARITVHAHYAGGELDSVHRYSNYHLNGDDEAGIPAVAAGDPETAWELLDRGGSLVDRNQPGEALPVLREAVRLNPEAAVAHSYLAAAMYTTNDLVGAEPELHAALKLAPDCGPVHNLLGILLFKRGDFPAAVTELRTSARLQPKDATVHFNFAQALEKSGDRLAALEQYRAAMTLAPDNAKFKGRYEQLAGAANAPFSALPSEATIKVEVRQVLVPVVVRDKKGHHVSGLTEADFHVFEDGVEQKISGFSVENAGVAVPAPPAAPEPSPGIAAPAAAAPKPVPIRRTYLICIDALHTQFANLMHIRQALSKLFQTEQAGDAQYLIVSVGTSMQVIENSTTDPASVLKIVDSKDFEKLFLGSRKSSMESDLRDFRRLLDEARSACDAGDPACRSLKSRLPGEANRIEEQDRMYTRTFLLSVSLADRTTGARLGPPHNRPLLRWLPACARQTGLRTVGGLFPGAARVRSPHGGPYARYGTRAAAGREQQHSGLHDRRARVVHLPVFRRREFRRRRAHGARRAARRGEQRHRRRSNARRNRGRHRWHGLPKQQRHPDGAAARFRRWPRILHAGLCPQQRQFGWQVPRDFRPSAE